MGEEFTLNIRDFVTITFPRLPREKVATEVKVAIQDHISQLHFRYWFMQSDLQHTLISLRALLQGDIASGYLHSNPPSWQMTFKRADAHGHFDLEIRTDCEIGPSTHTYHFEIDQTDIHSFAHQIERMLYQANQRVT